MGSISGHRLIAEAIRRGISQTSRASSVSALGYSPSQELHNGAPQSVLSEVSTVNLLRSLFLGYCFASPQLLNISLRLMNRVVHSRSVLLSPDKNPAIRGILRVLIYNHFCAGEGPQTVREYVERTKRFGYSGVILGYSREVLAEDVVESSTTEAEAKAIDSWLQANLNTLNLIGEGDHMSLK